MGGGIRSDDCVGKFNLWADDLNGLRRSGSLLLITSLIKAARECGRGKSRNYQHMRRAKFQSHYETPFNAFLEFFEDQSGQQRHLPFAYGPDTKWNE